LKSDQPGLGLRRGSRMLASARTPLFGPAPPVSISRVSTSSCERARCTRQADAVQRPKRRKFEVKVNSGRPRSQKPCQPCPSLEAFRDSLPDFKSSKPEFPMLQNKNHRDAVLVLSTNSRIQFGHIVERCIPASGEL
jgi:hypothetical protein